MNTEQNGSYDEGGYSSEYDSAMRYLEDRVKDLEDGIGIAFIKGIDLDEAYIKSDLARSLRVAIGILGSNN